METSVKARLLYLTVILATFHLSSLQARTAEPIDSQADVAAAGAGSAILARTDQTTYTFDDAGQEPHAHAPWLNVDGLTNEARELVRAIRDAAVHGLDPERYGLSDLMHPVDRLSARDASISRTGHLPASLRHQSVSATRQSLVRQMDRAFLQLATHLGRGVVDGSRVQYRMFHEPPPVNAWRLLEAIRRGHANTRQVLDSVTPQHADYQRLRARLRDLLTERASGLRRQVIADPQNPNATLSHRQIQALRSRLMDTGDLPVDTRFGAGIDPPLIEALNAFQIRHAIPPTGRFDPATRRVLDLSVKEEIQAVSLSLERWRWMPRELGHLHVLVNIPEFHVHVRQGNETRLSMAAVVGEFEHQTPTFSQDMTYLEFNPTWTVPARIANEELLPSERKQPGYLVAQQFQFLTRVNGKLVEVPAHRVTRADIRSDPFPYLLRQRSGSMNALGRVKFMLPNRHAIYLHDTLQQHHFRLSERAYSHGCIRLSDPGALARLLMQADGHAEIAIDAALRDTKLHRVPLRTAVPTHLAYLTTWIDERGELQRADDVYQQDEALLLALEEAGTLLTRIKVKDADHPGVPNLAGNS